MIGHWHSTFPTFSLAGDKIAAFCSRKGAGLNQ
jgi:hypothetical protein